MCGAVSVFLSTHTDQDQRSAVFCIIRRSGSCSCDHRCDTVFRRASLGSDLHHLDSNCLT